MESQGFISYYKENSGLDNCDARNDGYKYIYAWFKNKRKLDNFVKAVLEDKTDSPQEYANLRFVVGIQDPYIPMIFIRLKRLFNKLTSKRIKVSFNTFEESKSYIEWMVKDREKNPDKYKGVILRIEVKDRM